MILDHVESTAPLPDGLDYGIAFEPRTPGISQGLRESGPRSVGEGVSNFLLAPTPHWMASVGRRPGPGRFSSFGRGALLQPTLRRCGPHSRRASSGNVPSPRRPEARGQR